MQCTSCKSENVQRLSVVYDQGTQNIKTTGRTYGGGYGAGGAFGGATTHTSGTSRTNSAQKAAPPPKQSFKWAVLCVVLAVILIAATDFDPLGYLLILGGGFLGWRAYQYNKEKHPPLYERWQRSWMCNKCGIIYEH
jgi:hypothetical protein